MIMGWPRAAMDARMSAICAGVLPSPKTISGNPVRSVLWRREREREGKRERGKEIEKRDE
jgi:hypothetical protein